MNDCGIYSIIGIVDSDLVNCILQRFTFLRSRTARKSIGTS
jgi:hypothetical protein